MNLRWRSPLVAIRRGVVILRGCEKAPSAGSGEDETAEGAGNLRHGLLYAITPLGQPGPSMRLAGPG